ncbi:MAG: formyltetrahydrofolate deformylase [Chitinophagales bacterium]|nr:formyltetrahydrofolate deformylase [Chitinophagales bacterium]
MEDNQNSTAILLVSCPDKVGIVAEMTKLFGKYNGNIINLEQHVDAEENMFFMRLEWQLEGFSITMEDFNIELKKTAEEFNMNWEINYSRHRCRMAILVSKQAHCLYDILSRYESGEWNVEIPLVISNHRDLEPIVKRHGLEFHHIPISKENKAEQEEKEIALLREHNIDLIVLARYMQILSAGLVDQYPNRIINIHHSFLPAFPGARPYHSAYERGVKIIGATSHYVTTELDAGPIIDQDVTRVSHTESIKDFVHKGKDLEKIVLARAIRLHLQNKILVCNNKTIVFK